MGKAIMIQGTGSDVGKSVIVAGLARAFARRGLQVRPFKPQNMSNNAAATADGGEIGRAQALQAQAAGVAPSTDMNPVLLKPQSETGAQVIVQGKIAGVQEASAFTRDRSRLLPAVVDSFYRLATECDLVLVEGAGSPAETNLRAGDIANMGFATAADVPVVLLGDIDRGGVIAQIAGTRTVLCDTDQNQIKGFIINKFRGDVDLFSEGRKDIEHHTGWPCFGVVPWFGQARDLPAEDAQSLSSLPVKPAGLHIVVPVLPRLSNFDDLDPLAQEPGVRVSMIRLGTPLPADADVVMLAGSKSTRDDLAALKEEGWDIDIAAHVRRGGHVMGLCGGYQMLGTQIADPHGVEGDPGTSDGLGLLKVSTVLAPRKNVGVRTGYHPKLGHPVDGYEIHMGHTTGPDCARGWLDLGRGLEGAASADGRITGCYLHGLFRSDGFRRAWLAEFDVISDLNYTQKVEATLDALADHLEAHMDLDSLLNLAAPVIKTA